jgi:hypothetical protein
MNYKLAINARHPDCHRAADAFWQYWRENGETHRHGYYESTWGAINQAIKLVGVIPYGYGEPLATLEPMEARYADLLARLGVQGHDGAVAEIESLRMAAGLPEEKK